MPDLPTESLALAFGAPTQRACWTRGEQLLVLDTRGQDEWESGTHKRGTSHICRASGAETG